MPDISEGDTLAAVARVSRWGPCRPGGAAASWSLWRVVWATQVLDRLARSGLPSRAEITDAAMSERAECVMLNKGPHIIEAVDILGDILARMTGRQHKKTPLMRPLRSWRRRVLAPRKKATP